jgi:aminopeptidase-like protein
MTYGELYIPGDRKEELFFSTYLCHPSLANNELSGPAVTAFLARWLLERKNRYSIRMIFIPETIGSIYYISRNLFDMQNYIVAGFNMNCMGDERAWSYLPSRSGITLADRAILHVLNNLHPDFIRYSYRDRGSDERQYCAPGVDLPVASVMRSKYYEYPEYHTSLDNMDLITPRGLNESLTVMKRVVETIELTEPLFTQVLCEPKLDRFGFYPKIGQKNSHELVQTMTDLIAYADGRDSLAIAELLGVPLWELKDTIDKLKLVNILR